MCKESYIRPLENYVAKYGKDLRWLAIHCAMKPDDFLAKFQNKRATLGELMRTLEQGQIKLWLTISGEQPNYRSRVNPRMQFLLDNLHKFKISNDTIQKWTGSANQLAKWQSEDDIALSALLEVTKAHPKTILWHFIGLGEGDREDTMRNTFHKPSGEPSPVSRAAEIRHANMEKLLKKELETEEAELPDKLQLLKEKFNGPAKKEGKPVPEKTVSAKTEDSAPAAPAQEKNEPAPAAAGDAAVPPEDGNERFSVSYSHKLHMKIKAIALAEGKTNYAVINELIDESVALAGKIKKPVRDYKYDELVRNFMIVPKENIQVLRDIGEKKGWRIWQVCEACLTAAIREREERSRKEIAAAIAESQARARQQKSENKPEPAPAEPEAAVTPASEKQIKNTETKENTMAKTTTENNPGPAAAAAGKVNFEKWLSGQHEKFVTPFREMLKEERKINLIDGRYGEQTINAVRQFELPKDTLVVMLSCLLATDARRGVIDFGPRTEPTGADKLTIEANSDTIKSMQCRNDIVRQLNAGHAGERMDLKEPMMTEETKPRRVIAAMSHEITSAEDVGLTLIVEEKRFLGKKEVTVVPESVDILSKKNWIKLAIAVDEFCNRTKTEKLNEINKLISDGREEIAALNKKKEEVLDRLITQVAENAIDAGISTQLMAIIKHDNAEMILSEPERIEGNAGVRFKVTMSNDKTDYVNLDQISTMAKVKLLSEFVNNINDYSARAGLKKTD